MPNLVKVLAALTKEQRRLQSELNNVDAAISALRGMNGGRNTASILRPHRRLSVAARKRIAAAQKARWAKFRAQKKAAA